MMQWFDDLKKFAISDILSVSGKDKTARVIENHMNNLIEIAFIKGAASRQAEIKATEALCEMSQQQIDDLVLRNIELQKRIDDALGVIEDNHLNHIDALLLIVDILKGEEK